MNIVEEILEEINFSARASHMDGGPRCGEFRQEAMEKLPKALEERGFSLSDEWKETLELADMADKIEEGDYTIMNFHHACRLAIKGSIGKKPPLEIHFSFSNNEKEQKFLRNKELIEKAKDPKNPPALLFES